MTTHNGQARNGAFGWMQRNSAAITLLGLIGTGGATGSYYIQSLKEDIASLERKVEKQAEMIFQMQSRDATIAQNLDQGGGRFTKDNAAELERRLILLMMLNEQAQRQALRDLNSR